VQHAAEAVQPCRRLLRQRPPQQLAQRCRWDMLVPLTQHIITQWMLHAWTTAVWSAIRLSS
jgi:hypothetical protein